MQQFDIIADYQDLCGEGPLWNKDEQALYWTDIARRRFYRYAWSARRPEIVSERMQVSSYAFNQPGGFVITNLTGVWLWDGKSEPTLLAKEIDGHKCVMNDGIADPEGRVYSGSYLRNEQGEFVKGVGCLFRVDTDGSVHIADEGFQLSNGLGFSPDLRTLYFVDSAMRRIYSYDWQRADGSLRNRRIVVQVPLTEGVPDGLTVDAEGFIWCAHWFGGCVIRYDPDGKIERRLEVPALQTSSVTFGGPDFLDVFVTSAAETDSLSLAPPGYDPASGYVGGPVYHLKGDIRGREEYHANISKPRTGKNS
ncbi:MAG: SMP-30/gluconolactonase/LRE family protein [Bryobacteraceae bacterium]